MAGELGILFRKEWRQLLRSRGAVLTALILPAIVLLLVPLTQILAVGAIPTQELPEGISLPPGLANLKDDPSAIIRFVLPLMVSLGGLIVPMVSATYTIVAEREARTLELLVSLPVAMEQVILAKLLALLALTAGITVPMFSITGAALLWTGTAGPGFVAALALLLLAALTFSTTGALLISLLSKDFRTANNLSGALLLPAIFVVLGLLAGVPSQLAAALLAAGLLTVASVACALVSLKVVTFERLLR